MERPESAVTVPRVTSVPLIPREILFGNPERVSPHIAPDGARLAWIAPHEGVLNVWVQTVAGDESRVVTDDRERGIREFFWRPDNRGIVYLQDTGGDENWRLHDVELDSGSIRDLTPFEGVQARVVHVDKACPEAILVGLNRDNEELHDVYRLELDRGELTKVLENPGFVDFVADDELRVRAGLSPQPDGGMTLVVRDDAGDDWRPLLEAEHEDALTTKPLAFDEAGARVLVITSAGANAGRLIWIECATGAEQIVAEDPIYDVAGARLHPDSNEPQVALLLKERMDYLVLDPDIAEDVAALRAFDPGDLLFLGQDDADRTWLTAYNHDDAPVRYYAYDRETRQATFLFEHQPALSEYTLAPMEPFSFTARDGLTIRGYVTFPPGAERRDLPAVVNVHGGPWARDVWGFNPEAQWLANRGYLCIQVNYRGSTGYGRRFLNAGNREWGGKMHDDLVDAVRWNIARGHADPGRIAIYGGSYGGYAALVGAAFTPDLFCCAVDIVGPSSLKTLIESIPPYWTPLVAQFHSRVGNPETEADFLWSRSPLSRVGDIKIPLLIAQGANDPRVKLAESEQIVAALREKGIPHEYLLFDDEGHGFAKPENRLRFYAAAERFLAEHLGGRCEA
jgi:dipeptidyl aminopeptidase/acylaminoacyl peptidase